ncbi:MULTISPECIES: chromosome segregation protein SMC [Paenibacillus]|uniref:chromosome segregation protein SMC n=1 Tax=Paenibacillus TaxID=44249 RepID=UPI000CFB9B70|nr:MULTISPECIES: chromosome segregation protein SMC [Paenibacillus]MCL6659445.1 chromosome segregation protein SMC [Paenibacillus amylolyticus]PRA09288.1 chromosome segregation protein SMC [Paenibacillus sp. MYb63]PRA46042.1 chromosome segregation protein SMC [Paenibacillus sp. MYb67]
MFLKRIELGGFKSFADKTEMEFVRGITAVVGPNGSGKSNISDGIRWVLGEQSAKSLRGGKMEDIIFAGSDARKAVNFGEVSLTLDNEDHALALDFGEVTVTRRVHRSGDSEYFINKQSCRLKDITELFMDTGIGKEAYSIIGQGRIEEILSTRSEDRRGIFEEASGIVKYKSRKRDATRKLDETEQNLLRIHDLVTELEDQIGPLKEQSEKAIHYKELRSQLKSQEISMYVYQIEQIHASWSKANERLQSLKQEEVGLAAIVSTHDAKLENDRNALRILETETEQLQAALLQFSEATEKSEGLGELLKERSHHLQTNQEQLKVTLAASEERHRERETELLALREKFGKLEHELNDVRNQLSQEEAKLIGVTGGISQQQEESLKGNLLELMNQMAQTRNEIRYVDQQKETLERRMNRAAEESGKWEEQKETLESRKADIEKKVVRLGKEISDLRGGYITESERLQSLQKLLEESRGTVRKWEQKREAQVSRRDTMKEMQDDFDGFMLGVKEVLKASRKGTLTGVHGAVAELVKVPEKIELAVETAMGASLQHVVMENESVSRQAIAFLKQRQLGRATFLPLDVIRPRAIGAAERSMIEGMEGFVGIGADLVQFESKYASIIGSLLGNVIIAETLEVANKIAARCQYRFRVVTLEGDVVNAGGSMTGGSQHKKNVSLLSRKRQLDQLDQDILDTENQIVKLHRSVDDVKVQLEQCQDKLDELRQSGDDTRNAEQQASMEMKQVEHELRHVLEQVAVAGQEKSGFTEEIKELDTARIVAVKKLEQLEEEEKATHRAIHAAEFARKANESAKEELQSQLTELKVREGKLDQERFSNGEQLRRLEREVESLVKDLRQNRTLLASMEADLKKTQTESVKQIEDLNQYKLKKAEASQELDFKRAARSELSKKLELAESETKEQRTQLKAVEEQMRQTEISVNRLDVELENILRKLTDEYELGYELAKERYPVPEDVEHTQAEVQKLKRSISSLGDVNLGAIEEFQRVNERYEFLSEQKNDLVEAKTTLYQVIREMEDEMAKRFKITFDAIRREFGTVFTKLFGGGRADLVLMDPERLLETGIDIVAQPPGKKLQNLQLLSGGERALTAMALLFAILHVKPVPFCVLDEVEAALDEANVVRFAQYLREFSEQTQFIVVTHRKGTMEEADVLYGVTMEEGGVSKLVSVKLEDEEAVIA